MSMVIKPKNWKEFQHYKDRNPPWIKLHKSLLDNYEFQSLQLASKALAPCYWLLASEHPDGLIVVDHRKIAWRFRVDERLIRDSVKELISNGFFEVVQDASNALAECKQVAMPETETETETETEAETKRAPKAPAFSTSQMLATFPTLDEALARDFIEHRKAKRAKLTQSAWDGIAREIMASGMTPDAALRETMARGWTGFKAEWVQDKPKRLNGRHQEELTWCPDELRGTPDDPLFNQGNVFDAIN